MRLLVHPDSMSGPDQNLSHQPPFDRHYQLPDTTSMNPNPTQPAYGAQAPVHTQQTAALSDQQQQYLLNAQRERHHYESQVPQRNDSIQQDYFPPRAQALPTRPAHISSTYAHMQSDLPRQGAGVHQVWNSRSGIHPNTYNLGAQSWASQNVTDSTAQQQHSAQQQQQQQAQAAYLTPPGLSRPTFAHVDFPTPGSTPGIYTPRTPHDYSPLPTPIARPRSGPYGEPGPSSVIAAAPRRRSSGKDEFDGPHQFLPKPEDAHLEVIESQLIPLTISLQAEEQDDVLTKVNDCLSKCAFDFVAKYQFPIPIEADKRPVRVPGDREWTEWCHLLKRLATKRRIPMRVLWNGQIKQLVTVLENSLEMRHAAKHQSRPLKDDRNVLQLISAGLQVAKMLKDTQAMIFLDELYIQTERTIRKRIGNE
ncbi:hypothetical protein KVT40_008797 [Elsinoe batatas]|uniref:Uncharacterized protein n=1 Tax=Elsinoe batatas TaxID=2601811 RepID=A0A8K0PBV1_9PEZI|nr:hypothetical protein KVT40_008797 [Elsinoe batatas]